MCKCQIRNEGGFGGWADFDEFSAQITDTDFIAVPVKTKYSSIGFIEKWFQCNECGNVWRLVEPDPPFKGNWSQISIKEITDI